MAHRRVLASRTVKLRGRPGAPERSRGCTLSSSTRGDTTDPHGPLQRLLADELVVFGMCANPEPLDSVLDLVAEHPVVRAHARGPHRSDALEVKGGMPRVRFQ